MNILYHHRTRAEDAQGVHIASIVGAFRALGHDVEVVSVRRPQRGKPGSAERPRRPTPRGVRRALYEVLTLAYNAYGFGLLWRAIRRKRPRLIYERYSLNTFCGIWASQRFNIPLVLEVNAPFADEQPSAETPSFRRLARFSERWICSHATLIIAVSEVIRSVLIAQGIPASQILVLPNGIACEDFHPGVSGTAVRNKFALNARAVIGFVGWFRDWHGLDLLLQVAVSTAPEFDNLCFLLVGDGPTYPEIARYIAEHDLQKRVIVTGQVPHVEIPQYIAAFDIAVQPAANSYASPMKLLEYMAMARCIVAPDQPNIRELLENGTTAVLFHPGDAWSLEQALVAALRSPAQRVALGRAAQERILQRGYLWTENARRAIELAVGPSRADG